MYFSPSYTVPSAPVKEICHLLGDCTSTTRPVSVESARNFSSSFSIRRMARASLAIFGFIRRSTSALTVALCPSPVPKKFILVEVGYSELCQCLYKSPHHPVSFNTTK